MNKPTIICFGEVLWDLLPTGKIAGGAPMNVAYHLNNFGLPAKMLSRIGEDDLGRELRTFLETKGVDTELLQEDAFYPTGKVDVKLDDNGTATYKIIKPVAWDFININVDNEKVVKESDVLVFGSLSCRSSRTKETLLALIEIAKLKVFDVNLRAPYFNRETLEILLHKANIVKMNDEELALIGAWYFDEKLDTIVARKICSHFDINILIVTKGANGAFVVDPDNNVQQVMGKKVDVEDTIGSGDSFLAGFLYQYLNEEPMIVCMDFAARTGALVATHRGGTPKINEEMVAEIQ